MLYFLYAAFFKSKSPPQKKCLLWKYEFFGAPCLVGLLAANQRHIAVYREPLPGFLLVVEVLEGTGTDCLFPYYFTFIALSRLLLYLGLQLSSCMRTSESLGQKTAHSQPFLWFSGSTFSSPSPKTPMEILEETFIKSCILLFNRKNSNKNFLFPLYFRTGWVLATFKGHASYPALGCHPGNVL